MADQIFLADKITQDAIKVKTDLIGTANPSTGGTGNLFAFLKQINDFVDTVEEKLGLNTDTAGTTTTFARLAQIAAYVDTLEASLGQANDPMNKDGSVHAKLRDNRDLLGWLSSQIGSNVDLVHPDGSVHAKLKDIKNAITASTDWSKKKPRASYTSSVGLTSPAKELVNIIGKGYFTGLDAVTNYDSYINIVIDGVYIASIGHSKSVIDDNVARSHSLSAIYRFESSLKLVGGSGGSYGNTYASYCISYVLD
ncbi:hypothetical protein P9597_26620 [Aneurinibacillus migulanus]|uniref:hypothetical protein n=1 Tax=Aneurinibacillus migulanus TaxID=47500 RepID=UPI002E2114DE|nr:hypothetical protein [Aneurinibacillus migulanus]